MTIRKRTAFRPSFIQPEHIKPEQMMERLIETRSELDRAADIEFADARAGGVPESVLEAVQWRLDYFEGEPTRENVQNLILDALRGATSYANARSSKTAEES